MKLVFSLILIALLTGDVSGQFLSFWDAMPDHIRAKNSYKRFEWFYRPRTDEFGNYPKAHIEKQRLYEETRIKQRLSKSKNVSDQWTSLGPKGINMSSSFVNYWGEVSGRVRGLAVHPTNPDIVYIGAAAGGIWKTTNGGSSWTDLSSGFERLTFGAICIDPNNGDVVYAGTGEGRWGWNDNTYEGDGLYKTTNGGTTWTKITNGIGTQTQFCDITVSPHNSNHLLAALGSGNWNNGFPNNEGVWRSTDAGSTWTRVINVDDAFDVAFHPSNSSFAYAASGNQSASGGFYKSTDGGATWTQSNSGLPSTSTIGRIQFDLAPSSPSTIYSVIYNYDASFSSRNTAAFKSTDGGANWVQISSGVNIAGSYDGTNADDQGYYDLCLAVHPTDPNTVYLGNVEMSRTTDGSTLSLYRNPSGYYGGTRAWDCWVHVDIHNIKFAPSNGNIVYLGCDGGVYKSTDAGASWQSVNNSINTIQFYRVASHPTNSSILFGGSQDNGNFRTTDKGSTAWVFKTTGDGMECFVDYNDPNYVFMSTQNGWLNRSTDGGANFSTVLSNVSTNTAWTAPYWQHPTDYNKVYAAVSRQLYRSTDRGANWSSFSTITSTNRITSVTQSSVNTNNMMAVESYYTTSPKVWKSTDEGATWTEITSNLGFTGTNIQRVISHPTDANTFYLTRASYSSGQIYRTTDFGVNWSNISGNLPQVTATDLFVDPANTDHLYAANDFGVYWSSNGGTSWTKLSNGMPFVPIHDFSFYNYSGVRYLRAASHGRGVYELQIDSPLPVELESFNATLHANRVLLNWRTATEVNNYGFELERGIKQEARNEEWIKVGFIQGHGNSNSAKEYSFTDNLSDISLSALANPVTLVYRLKQIDTDGSFSYSEPIEVKIDKVSISFALYQNYPNPFGRAINIDNSTTKIKYNIPMDDEPRSMVKVSLKVYDLLGSEVAVLVDEEKAPGEYETEFKAVNLSGGIYYYRLTAGNNTAVKKMVLMK